MKSFLLPLAAVALASACALTAPAQSPAAAPSPTPTAPVAVAKPKVVGLLFYADWCASCEELEPKLNAIKRDFAGQPVLFTRVDFTDDFTKEQSDLLAASLDLGAVYQAQGRTTGFMLLIDPVTRQPVGKLVKTQSEAELKAAVEAALRG